MTAGTRFCSGGAGWRCWASWMGRSLFLLVLAAAMVMLASCDLFGDEEPDLVLSGGQTWSGRNWSVQLDGSEWTGCTVAVQLTITHSGGSVANFGYTDEETTGYLYVRDKYNEVFEPHKGLFWEKQFYEEKFYPNETRSGVVEYKIDSRAEQIQLYMTPDYAEEQVFSFDLGAVPDSCE